ncbi:Ethylmalonyl-CoA decarboxylase [Frankliniella fusca]|uniref:Ethylmalonyl-CoA decarboxylase n=1 Tax=Frankliniella fusca TaxID=407009 RepID=A0AAE1HKR7_9NEOP|nr:Ethylmalonyl-CoA decarboxylase [Frankliniella fusca]
MRRKRRQPDQTVLQSRYLCTLEFGYVCAGSVAPIFLKKITPCTLLFRKLSLSQRGMTLLHLPSVVRTAVRTFIKPLPSMTTTMSCYSDCGVHRFDGEDVNLVEVKEWLSQFGGGSVSLETNDSTGVAEIVLCHPSKKNAISGLMMVQLGSIIERLEKWSLGKGILVRGDGSMFCSGGDLDFARASAGAEGGFKMSCYMQNILSRLKALPMVSIALIHGQGALGGGAEIATACDWRLMTCSCLGIGLVHTRMGIVPAWGATSRLATLVGSRTALELITSARIVKPEEALKLGLIDAIVDPGPEGNGFSDASEWLLKHIQTDSEVIRAAKLTLTHYDNLVGRSKVLEEERRLFAPLWGGPANQKALNSRIKHLK